MSPTYSCIIRAGEFGSNRPPPPSPALLAAACNLMPPLLRASGEPLAVSSCLPHGYELLPQISELSEAAPIQPGKMGSPTGQPITEAFLSAPANPNELPAALGAAGEWEEVRADGVYGLEFEDGEGESQGGDWNPPSPNFQAWPLSCDAHAASVFKTPVLDEPTVNVCTSRDREGEVGPIEGRKNTASIVQNGSLTADNNSKPDGFARSTASSTGTPCVEGSLGSSEATEPSSPGVRGDFDPLSPRAGVSKIRRETQGDDDDDDDDDYDNKEKEKEQKREREFEKEADRTPPGVIQGTGDAILGRASVAPAGTRYGLDNGPQISRTAEGLLAKLRGAIRSRVRTIPYPASRVAACTETPYGSTTTMQPRNATAVHLSAPQSRGGRGQSEPGGDSGTMKTSLGGIEEAVIGEEDGDRRAGGAVGGLVDAAGGVDRCAGGLQGSRDGDAEEAVAASPVVARVGVLFSGGLDSVVLAAMLAETGGEGGGGPAVPKGEAIDLINVCFDR